jgi:succinate-acetate transporter protein
MSMSDIEKAYPSQYPMATPSRTKISNPAALGLFSFASTTLILSLYNIGARGITAPNVVVGMAIFTGGLAQLLAGMWEFPCGNMFGATAFTSYGAFWMSFATILLPGSGIIDAYKDEIPMLESALGIYLMTWFVFTFILFIVTLRKSVAFIALFGLLATTFLILAVGKFATSELAGKIGGYTGILTAVVAYYIGLSQLLASEKNPTFTLPLGAFD